MRYVLREMKSMSSILSVVIALLLAMSSTSVVAWPTHALDVKDGRSPTPPTSSATSPLLDALAFAPPGIISFEFTDWTALKALHDGSDITSASPLDVRQRLVLDMVNSEASTRDFGLGRLATWPELWGWDNTDLAWEATWVPWFDSSAKVLRFREGWDPQPFIARLEEYGYSRSQKTYGTVFGDAPDFHPAPASDPVLAVDERLAPWPVSVAISPDGYTVVIREGDAAHELLSSAARSDPEAVAASPFGRVALALGRPVAAHIVDGNFACLEIGPRSVDWPADMTALAATVGPLQPYQAFGTGYERAGPGEPAVGRYAFTYEQAGQAMADLPARRMLIHEGTSMIHGGKRYRDVAFALVEAQADEQHLVLDVVPLYDSPQVLFDLSNSQAVFASCGGSEQIPHGPLVPLGPTTSGGRTTMPGSGFAVNFPAEWSVEMAEPDPGLALALSGDAWEALRAYGPERRQTCSVYVVVMAPGSPDLVLMEVSGLREPRWADFATRPVLQIPDSRDRVEAEDPSGPWVGAIGDFDRGAADDPVLDHDVVYTLRCAADVDTSYDTIYDSFMFLPLE
jgi:hypothetical protein